jgi:phage recombination protein Bet
MTSELAIRDDQQGWSPKQVAALTQLGVKDAAPGDLAVFFHQAVRSGLDPFAKQIYMIGRNSSRWDPETRQKIYEVKQTIQTAIDGFRLIARRAADKAHHTLAEPEILWCGYDGKWRDVWLNSEPPSAAKATVLRDGQPFVAVALYSEYVQVQGSGENAKPNSMWTRMPTNQLAKCAEALALRKAFPQDLSGMYIDDEMGQADGEAQIEQAPAESGPPEGGGWSPEFHERKRKRMFALFNELDLKSRDAQVTFIEMTLGRELGSRANMTTGEFVTVIEALEKVQRETPEGVSKEPVDAEVVEDGPMFPDDVDPKTGEVST